METICISTIVVVQLISIYNRRHVIKYGFKIPLFILTFSIGALIGLSFWMTMFYYQWYTAIIIFSLISFASEMYSLIKLN